MVKLSANLGFLWTELELPDQIRAAARAGFGAVECHFPFAVDPAAVNAALDETGIPMLGLNTVAGGEGDFGLGALPGREIEAVAAIDQAISYASEINCRHVSVLAGLGARTNDAETALRANLTYACLRADEHDLMIVIEPMSEVAVPGAYLQRVADAVETIEAVGRPNLKIMLDIFHTEQVDGNLTETIRGALSHIGHIQFAAVPDRHEPDHGDVDVLRLLPEVEAMGYTGWFGAEYHPRATTEAGLGWMRQFRPPTKNGLTDE